MGFFEETLDAYRAKLDRDLEPLGMASLAYWLPEMAFQQAVGAKIDELERRIKAIEVPPAPVPGCFQDFRIETLDALLDEVER